MQTFLDGRVILHCGDCVAVLATLDECSVDSIVCDPPYGLEFMGKEWDGADGFRRSLNEADAGRDSVFGRTSRKSPEYRASNAMQMWCGVWARECLRVLKPGGFMLAFSSTRTQHRMVCAIEDAGFEVRDQIGWAYGSGMNKVGYIRGADGEHIVDGWGGSLKPAWEPICVARKPVVGTVAENMRRHGTGALNIDGCRVDSEMGRPLLELDAKPTDSNVYAGRMGDGGLGRGLDGGSKAVGTTDLGRWPANLIHDGSDEVVACFPDSKGQQGDVKGSEPSRTGDENTVTYGKFNNRVPAKARRDGEASANRRYAESGGTNFAALPGMRRGDGASAARFFYSSKADADDRLGSKHPTVKPIDLMQYLVRLVTPKGGVVLDPFAGTGTTGEAAWREGMNAVLIEREPEYQADIGRRMELACNPTKRAAVAKSKNNLASAEDLPLFAREE